MVSWITYEASDRHLTSDSSFLKTKENINEFCRMQGQNKSVLLWANLDQDQWLITHIIVHQRNYWIHSDQKFIGSFDVLYMYHDLIDHCLWGGSVAKWLGRRTLNPEVEGSSPALTT